MFIGAALERNHQFRSLGQPAPASGVEFSNAMSIEVDFALIAAKTQREPDLLLTLPAPRCLGALLAGGEVVVHPLFGVAEQAGRVDARLLLQLAHGGL